MKEYKCYLPGDRMRDLVRNNSELILVIGGFYYFFFFFYK